MRQTLFPVLAGSLMLLVFSIACDIHTGSRWGITVYEHPNFKGSSHSLDIGASDLGVIEGPCQGIIGVIGGTVAGSTSQGDWDNCISSIRIPPGWEVSVWRLSYYREECLTFNTDVPDLTHVRGPCKGSWNDCISSLSVREVLRP